MEKPLPDIPAPTARPNLPRTGANLTALTVEAHEHLRKLLSRLLEEEEVVSDKEVWVDALQSGLRELGEGIALGGWLAGLKRARLLKRGLARKKEIERRSETGQAEGAADDERDVDFIASRKEDPPKDAQERRRDDLESLQVVLQRPTSPTPKPRVRHLLLTLTPHEYLSFRHMETSCKFILGKFTLPDYDASEEEIENVLHGLDDWSSEHKFSSSRVICSKSLMQTHWPMRIHSSLLEERSPSVVSHRQPSISR